MTKQEVGIWLGVGLMVIGFSFLFLKGSPTAFRGISESISFGSGNQTVTNTTTTCGSGSAGAVSYSVVPTGTSRTSFMAWNNSTNTITLCRSASSTCQVNGSGLGLTNGTNTLSRYEQLDGYIGPYSCIASNGSSTLGLSYSQ